MAANQNDPFMNALLATTYEKQGKAEKAKSLYGKAFEMARAHNPPAAYARWELCRKLGM